MSRTNDIPWVDGAIYQYRLVFRPGQIEIEIREDETVVESWIVADDLYTGGRFGYYINSLQNVHYGKLSFSLDDGTLLRIVDVEAADGYIRLGWEGGTPPYTIEGMAEASSAGWILRGSNLSTRTLLLPNAYEHRVYRVSGNSTPP